MATWKTFEEIHAWQKGRELGRHVYSFTREKCERDYAFINQIRAAVVSIMSNIAEGFERDGVKEFHQFLSVAKGSAGEVRSQLYIALDQGYIDQGEFDRCYSLANEVCRLSGGLMRYLEQTEIKGHKFPRSDSGSETPG
jgi:four helix bundle protein